METAEMHKKFLAILDQSREAVWTVAQWLSSRGYSVSIPAQRNAPTYEQRLQYSDNGDLFIEQRIEVKRLSVNFTGRHDWPFGKDFIVTSRSSYERAFPKPYCYVVLSNDKTHMGIAMCSDDDKWTVGVRKDSRFDDMEQEYVFCPIDLVKFARMA